MHFRHSELCTVWSALLLSKLWFLRCRKPNTYPMDGNCNVESIIYKAEVTAQTTKETFIGLCDTVQGITQAHLAMNGVETQPGFFQNDFEEKSLF